MEGEKNPEVPDSNDSPDKNAEENREEMIEPETDESVSSRQDIPELDSDHNTAENLCQMKGAEDNVAKGFHGDSSWILTKAQIEATCAEISARYAQHFLSKSSRSADHSGGGNYDGRTIYIGPHVRFSMPIRGARRGEISNLTEVKDIEVYEGRMDETTDDNSASDKDLGFDEIVESNPAALGLPSTSEGKIKEAFEKRRDFLIDEATSSKSSSNSASFPSPSGESSGDSYPISNVYVTEENILDETNTENKSRYKKNLGNFLKNTETRKTLIKISKRSGNQKTLHSTKELKSGKSFSDIFKCCGILNGLNSVLQKIKTGRKSSSAPPTVYDIESLDNIKSPLKRETEGESYIETPNQFLLISPKENICKDTKSSTNLTSVMPHNGPDTLLRESQDSSRSDLSVLFKMPIPPKYKKSPKSLKFAISSPGTTKLSKEICEKSPSNPVERPSDLDVSPRSSFYIFSPGSPTGMLKQCRSLPNISQNPRKGIKRASMNFGKPQNNFVKALFTGEMEPTTPESLISQIKPDEAAKQVLSQRVVEAASSESQVSNPKSDNLVSNKVITRTKIASRKKLIFVSPVANTNISSPLQVSSMPTDISTNISCLEISEAENQPSPIITLPETPPKRKISIPEYTSPESKKIRLGDQSVEKAEMLSPVKIKSTDVEQICSNVDEIAHEKSSFPSAPNVSGPAEASVTELHVAGSSGSEETTEESKKAKKRPKKMTAEDNEQMEPFSEPKKKKDAEDF